MGAATLDFHDVMVRIATDSRFSFALEFDGPFRRGAFGRGPNRDHACR